MVGEIKNAIHIEISWLEKLVAGLKTLKPEEFKYDKFVTNYDDIDELCGTVCCAYGWMPRFVPEAGVNWSRLGMGYESSVHMTKSAYRAFNNIDGLQNLNISIKHKEHLDGRTIINFMFHGEDLCKVDKHKTRHIDIFSSYKRYHHLKGVDFNNVFGDCEVDGLNISIDNVINRIEYSILILKAFEKRSNGGFLFSLIDGLIKKVF